ncbi:MAG: hypothetical protein JNL26_12990 [Gemmatimonadetes bacterium]|nr:hypothetical protein [Gemmatimonadota bacterium]
MHTHLRGTLRLLLVGVAVAACQDSDYRIDQLDTSFSMDSAMKVLSDGNPIDTTMRPPPGALVPASDTLKNVWRKAEYLIDGNNIQVLYYSPNNEKWKATDTIPKEKVIPVIFVNGKLFGTGRRAYEDAMDKWNLPASLY